MPAEKIVSPILLVEDDAKLAQCIELYLKKHGYSVIIAHSGENVDHLLRTHHPSCVLLDCMLPGGKEFQSPFLR
jgi:DNA-binding response OmpR family regulator